MENIAQVNLQRDCGLEFASVLSIRVKWAVDCTVQIASICHRLFPVTFLCQACLVTTSCHCEQFFFVSLDIDENRFGYLTSLMDVLESAQLRRARLNIGRR
jgi:hypothetical protein